MRTYSQSVRWAAVGVVGAALGLFVLGQVAVAAATVATLVAGLLGAF